MYSFNRVGKISIGILGQLQLRFQFVGHGFLCLWRVLKSPSLFWGKTFLQTIYLSGVRLFLPVVVFCVFIGFSLSVSLDQIFRQLPIESQAQTIVQNAALITIAPLLLGLMLATQSALNLINAKVHQLHHTPEEVMVHHILPISLGILCSGMLLYVYAFVAILSSIYLTFQWVIYSGVRENFFYFLGVIRINDLLYAIFKLLIYCGIVGFVVGYHYYAIALRKIDLRRAVSRIMTRSILFIVVVGAFLNYLYL